MYLETIPDHILQFWPEADLVMPQGYDPAKGVWLLTDLAPWRVDGQWPVRVLGHDEKGACGVGFCVNVRESFSLLNPRGWRPEGTRSFNGQLKELFGETVEWNGEGFDMAFVTDYLGRPSAILKHCYAKSLPGVPYSQKHHTLRATFTLFEAGQPMYLPAYEVAKAIRSPRSAPPRQPRSGR